MHRSFTKSRLLKSSTKDDPSWIARMLKNNGEHDRHIYMKQLYSHTTTHTIKPASLLCSKCNLSIGLQGRVNNIADWLQSDCITRDFAPVPAADALMHPSHSPSQYKGLHFCTVCGAWKVRKSKNLLQPCPRHATTAGSDALKRIAKGKPPGSLKQWPCP